MKIRVEFEFDSPTYIETVSRIVEMLTEDNPDPDILAEALYHLLYVAKDVYEFDAELKALMIRTAKILHSFYEAEDRPPPSGELIFRPSDEPR